MPAIALLVAGFVREEPALYGAGIAWALAVVAAILIQARSLGHRITSVAQGLMAGRDPAVVARSLEALVDDARGMPQYHCATLIYLAIAKGRLGDADGGVEVLEAVQRSGWIDIGARWRSLWTPPLFQWLVALNAARGDTDAAARWLQLGRAKLPAAKHVSTLTAGQCILALRQGNNDEAIKAAEAVIAACPVVYNVESPSPASSGDWGQDALPMDPTRAAYGVLRAFAMHRAGRPMPGDEVRALVNARARVRHAVLPLERWWPEYAAYLEAHAS
jgi:hypothetical protein